MRSVASLAVRQLIPPPTARVTDGRIEQEARCLTRKNFT